VKILGDEALRPQRGDAVPAYIPAVERPLHGQLNIPVELDR
jgi:hypothetical protein